MSENSPSASSSNSFIARFFKTESAAGLTLIAAAVIALAIANSPARDLYFSLLHREAAGLSVTHWINDGLMAIFFLLVGLEIKREFIAGQLSTWTQRALPGIAALGGMIIPAAIYLIVNSRSPETLRGWAIPAATDIAFALGVLSLLGKRVPVSLKVFLTALAVLDDLGAVVIIALFYTSDLSVPMLMYAFAAIVVLLIMNRLKVRNLAPYLIVGIILWNFTLLSGVHATLAGVALALCIPMGTTDGENHTASPLMRLEEKLHSWVAFAVVPIFGLANAGVSLSGISLQNLIDPVPLGIALGLLLGKQIGIFASSAIAVRAGIAQLPEESSWTQLYGVSLICGIGFTMSLFIGSLAFANSAHLIDEVKVGVLMGSVLAALAGVIVMRWARR